jgi:[ribosomal protein S18]-alanine N-acetyltransferase
MKFEFKPITIDDVKQIEAWKYEGDIDDLYMAPYYTSYEKMGKLIGPGGCDGFVALLDNHLAGIFEFTLHDNYFEIGLAFEPSLVGKGLGADFVNEGIAFGLKYYNGPIDFVRLMVEEKNIAAIKVYEKAGFQKVNEIEGEIEMRKSL